MEKTPELSVFPLTSDISKEGHLVIGGCNTIKLASEFGTPLYLFDELDLRARCREFKTEFGKRYAEVTVIYAAKAFINRALATIFKEEGLGLDVVSGGEISIAQSAGFPPEQVYFHGNNKSAEELKMALKWNIGRIVVDNFNELEMLDSLSRELGHKQDILLRLTPGVDPHTHKYIATGVIDSKFGFSLSIAEKAFSQAMEATNLNLVGLHCHIGSLIFETEPYQKAIDAVLDFAAEMRQKHGFSLKELNVGGGYAIQYTYDSPAPPVSVYAEAISSRLINKCRELKMPLPRLVIEPGRSIVGRAGVALYQVGAIKDIPDVRRYVSVDGGMADNIRPAIYGSRYEALVANKARDRKTTKVTIAGKFCESGDILIKDIILPPVSPGDIIAVPDCGAYCLSMASNYNASLKPAIVMVKEGTARLIRRRETFEDLGRNDLV